MQSCKKKFGKQIKNKTTIFDIKNEKKPRYIIIPETFKKIYYIIIIGRWLIDDFIICLNNVKHF